MDLIRGTRLIRAEGIESVVSATLSPANSSSAQDAASRDANIFCFYSKGSRHCPQIKHSSVSEYERTITPTLEASSRGGDLPLPSPPPEVKDLPHIDPPYLGTSEFEIWWYPVAELSETGDRDSYANVHGLHGEAGWALLKDMIPCASPKILLSCGENHVLAACAEVVSGLDKRPQNKVKTGSSSPKLCDAAQQCLFKAQDTVRDFANSLVCPQSTRSGPEGGFVYCPEKSVGSSTTWEVMLAVFTGSKWVVGALAELPVLCPPKPGSPISRTRQPADPDPESGGGTPTGGGGGTPTGGGHASPPGHYD